MKIFSCNVGSSSLKIRLYAMPQEKTLFQLRIGGIGTDRADYKLDYGEVQRSGAIDMKNHLESVRFALDQVLESGVIKDLDELDAIGFKTVHAGPLFGPAVIGERVLEALEYYLPAAPLHNRIYLESIRAFAEAAPQVRLVGVFETHFHRHMPAYAASYALPYEWQKEYHVRKYGFHGSSHGYIAQRAPEIMGRNKRDCKIISCHLGGSSSICAIKDGISIDTSMGFSPESGIPMGTRSGDLDIYVLPFMEARGYSPEELKAIMLNESGLKGLSGVGSDIRDLEEAALAGNERAQLALDVFAYSVKRYIGSYFAVLGGADAIVFTGGIGENASALRKKILEDLDCLGVKLDEKRNVANKPESLISKDKSPVKVYMIPTDEEIMVARATLKTIRPER